jgi:hypothetical protein
VNSPNDTPLADWQTIESAPKESPLWLYSMGYAGGAVAGYWDKRHGWWTAVGKAGSCLVPTPKYWLPRTEPPAPPDFHERGG